MAERKGGWRPGPIMTSMAIYLTVFLTVQHGTSFSFRPWQAILLYVVIYAVISQVMGRNVVSRQEIPDYSHLPTSGPVGRGGQSLLMFTFMTSGVFSFLNPVLFWQQMRQLTGHLFVARRLGSDLPEPESYRHVVQYRLPVQGDWLVYNGGITPATSHSWGVLTQRYAYDLVVVDEQYGRHTDSGTRCNDYYCYGLPIVAAADGEVVEVRDGVRDSWFLGYGLLDVFTRDFRGNFVTIRHAEAEYTFSAHLIPGSIEVAVGDRVQQGQRIGRCGHSGFSSEPHLHFHLQDQADFFTAMGLPIGFADAEILEQLIDAGDYLSAGARVRNTSAPGKPPSLE